MASDKERPIDFQLLIAGRWISPSSREQIAVIDPSSGEDMASLPVATEADLGEAAAAAAAVFSLWAKRPASECSALLRSAARLLRERSEGISRLLTREQGKPLAESRAEIESAAAYTEYYADEALRISGNVVSHPEDPAIVIATRLGPIGPSLIIVPWNFPVVEGAIHVAPAIASGSPVILKPPETAPGAAIEYARCFVDAGAPPGLIQVVAGVPSMISEFLIADPRVRRIAFTGSTAVGRRLSELAGRHLKTTVMELGGNAPFLITHDANIDKALSALQAAKLRNAGQVCIAPNRIFVARERYDEVVDRLARSFATVKVTSGLDPEAGIGPLANKNRVPYIEKLLSASPHEIITGGKRIGNRGYFYSPTVVTGASDASALFVEEIFGPVAVVYKFDDLDEAVARANATQAGLAAYAFTGSAAAARHLSAGLHAGMVGINTTRIASIATPFGGVKDSGWGRVGGREGLLACVEAKLISEAAL